MATILKKRNDDEPMLPPAPATPPVSNKPPVSTPPATAKPAVGTAPPGAKKLGLTLPTTLSTPSKELGDYSLLLHGEKKVGKTLLASQFPNSFHLMFEPGGEALAIMQRPVPTWGHFVEYVDLLEGVSRENRVLRTAIIDTSDIAYDLCFKYVAKKKGFTHPNELNFGEGWQAIETEFSEQLLRLTNAGYGIIFISHTEMAEFLSRIGGKYNKLIPSLAKAARKFITGFADTIAYAGYYGEKRLLTIQGSDNIEAGTRCENNFWVKGKEPVFEWIDDPILKVKVKRTKVPGVRVHSIEMGDNAADAYYNLLVAFANQQASDGRPTEKSVLSETPVPRKVK